MLRKRHIHLISIIAAIFLCFIGFSPSFAQKIPAPEEILGFKIGADFHLATYDQALEYLRVLQKISPMIKLFEMGKTSMGKPMIYAVITAKENMAALDRYKSISKKLALVKGLSEEEAHELAAEGRAVVYIEGGVHAPECAPTQSQIQLAYDLLSSQDKETRFILDNVIFLLVFPNPDGMQMLAQWYLTNVGTPYEISPMPWLYHKYAGHDNNRDTFMGNLEETRNIVRIVNQEWHPVIFHSHHQRAPFPARIWIPPAAEPTNPNTHPLSTRGRTLIGSKMGFKFAQEGKEGAISRIIHSFWYAGYMDWFFGFFNIIATLTETALYHYATPNFYPLDEFPEEYKDLTVSTFYPNPWKGGWWKFADAVEYSLIASKSVLQTAALFREQFLYSKYKMGFDTITRFQKEPPYAWIIPQEQRDPPVAARLLNWLRELGIEIQQAKESFASEGLLFPAGTWVIPMNQPFALCLKAIFEDQKYPDLSQQPTLWQGIVNPRKYDGAYHPPFDTAGWTLQYQMGVKAISAMEPLGVNLEPVNRVRAPAGRIEGKEGFAYLFSPKQNNSFIAINRILQNGGKVLWSREPFMVEGKSQLPGTMIVLSNSVSRSFISSLSKELFLPIQALKSRIQAKSYELKSPRIALYQSWKACMDEGWTRWLLEKYEFPFSSIRDAEIQAGELRKKLDVIILPSMLTDAIVNGHKKGTVPPRYAGGMTSRGVRNLRLFVEEGGTLVTLNSSCLFAIDALDLPVCDVLEDVRPPLREMGADPSTQPAKFACPGSLLRMKFDSHHPVAFGMPEEAAGMFMRSPAFTVEETTNKKKPAIIVKYPGHNLLMSGYLMGEKYILNKASVLEVPYGMGRIILLGFAVQNRAQPHVTFKLLFNSLYYSAAVQ